MLNKTSYQFPDFFLTKKEQQEPINVTLGRLRARMVLNEDERALLLLEKISDEIRERDIF